MVFKKKILIFIKLYIAINIIDYLKLQIHNIILSFIKYY